MTIQEYKDLIKKDTLRIGQEIDPMDEFYDYVDSFYGVNDPLYPLVYQGEALTRSDIIEATKIYLDQCNDDNFELCTWGDGDSLDRERVRDILTDKFNYDHKEG